LAWPVGSEALTGVWPIPWYHKIDAPGAREFTTAFERKFGKPLENQAWGDYLAVKVITAATEKAKSTDSKALVKTLENFQFDGMRGRPLYFRDWDHQLMQPMYVVRAKKKAEMKDKWDIWHVEEEVPGKKESWERIALSRKDSECQLEPMD